MQEEIYVGSRNQAKLKAVELAIQELKQKGVDMPTFQVIGVDVPSGVAAQPYSDEETISGALNRCLELKKNYPASLCIGLEGGVQRNHEGLFVCNWGVLLDEHGKKYVASGARVKLPEEVAEGLDNGKELSEMMELYSKRKDIRSKEGAIGILTEGLLDRSTMFAQVTLLLFGQKLHAQDGAYSVAKM
ncbi:DUF84 family protein [Bacillus horti]|nr:DUF84 family protein [Bacillus horti]